MNLRKTRTWNSVGYVQDDKGLGVRIVRLMIDQYDGREGDSKNHVTRQKASQDKSSVTQRIRLIIG